MLLCCCSMGFWTWGETWRKSLVTDEQEREREREMNQPVRWVRNTRTHQYPCHAMLSLSLLHWTLLSYQHRTLAMSVQERYKWIDHMPIHRQAWGPDGCIDIMHYPAMPPGHTSRGHWDHHFPVMTSTIIATDTYIKKLNRVEATQQGSENHKHRVPLAEKLIRIGSSLGH